jgi:hypothetical protein
VKVKRWTQKAHIGEEQAGVAKQAKILQSQGVRARMCSAFF